MPGPPGSESPWGELPLFMDTSAWVRAGHPTVRERFADALSARRLWLAPVVRLEILFHARSGANFDELAEELSVLRPAGITGSIAHAAESAMHTMAHRSHGAHRLPVIDYLVAATAQESGAAVLHYDHDYDTLAEVMSFESVWLGPPGSMP